MSSELEQLINKCRCCFSTPVKLKKIDGEIQAKFYELMKIQLTLSANLSDRICLRCLKQLNDFSSFQQQMFLNQTKLLELENESIQVTDFKPASHFLSIKHEMSEDENLYVQSEVYAESLNFNSSSFSATHSLQDTFPTSTVVSQSKADRPKGSTLNAVIKKRKNRGKYKICEFCSKTFKSSISFQRHYIAHINEINNKPFICDLCGYRTFRKGNIASHILKHDRDRNFQCHHCSKTFKFKTHVLNHEKSVHEAHSKFHLCGCGKSFKTADLLKIHNSTYHILGRFPCPICAEVFETKGGLYVHKATHKPKIACEVCGSMVAPNKLQYHLQTHENAEYREKVKTLKLQSGEDVSSVGIPMGYKLCEYCPKIIVSSIYKRHVRGHINEINNTPFICDFCGYKTFKKGTLASHILKHDSERNFPCQFCPKSFKVKNHLKQHTENIHTATTRSTAEFHHCQCGKAFKSLNLLKIHKSYTHEVGQFPCTHCDEVFKTKSKLYTHQQSHKPRVPCEACGVMVMPGKYYVRHLKIHQKPLKHEKHKCEFEGCGKKFSTLEYLKHHMDSHDPKNQTICPTCNAVFSSQLRLKVHFDRQHKTPKLKCEVPGCDYSTPEKRYMRTHYENHKNIDETLRHALISKLVPRLKRTKKVDP